MAENPADKSSKPSKEVLDLNSLSGLDFGPSWADPNAKKTSGSPSGRHDRGDARKGGKPRSGGGSGPRDRRGPGGSRPNREGSESRGGHFAQSNQGGARRDRKEHRGAARPVRDFFKPTVKIDLYPQDEAFEALVKRLRSTVRTYQLFEIAHLLLEKPERFVVVVANFPAKGGAATQSLFFSVPGHLPFETEEAAVAYVLKNHLDLFFDIEEIEVEAPKGNFQMVNRCSQTGALLGPPNYHRYQEFLQRHYSEQITGQTFDQFTSKIETVKDQESIDAWLESMKKGTRYILKDRAEGEPEALESLEAVKLFLMHHRKDQVVGSGESVRFAGRDLARMPDGDLRRSVETYVEQQKHFPLDTANNIRGRLRRHKFTVYKKGSKGVSYVCAVKRKFRDSNTAFTDSIQKLIEFIEQHPDIPASKLPKVYIGVDTEKQNPAKLVVSEADIEAAKAQAPEASDTAEAPAIDPAAVAASTEATPKSTLTDDEQKLLNQLMLDLRWLIVEGYVTEYGDGRLYAPAPMPEAKKDKEPESSAVSEEAEAPASDDASAETELPDPDKESAE